MPGKIIVNERLCICHQGYVAEATVALLLNQGACTDVLYYHPCLNFFVRNLRFRLPFFLSKPVPRIGKKESDKLKLKRFFVSGALPSIAL